MDNSSKTLSIINLCRLKQIQIYIESNIIEKKNYYSQK